MLVSGSRLQDSLEHRIPLSIQAIMEMRSWWPTLRVVRTSWVGTSLNDSLYGARQKSYEIGPIRAGKSGSFRPDSGWPEPAAALLCISDQTAPGAVAVRRWGQRGEAQRQRLDPSLTRSRQRCAGIRLPSASRHTRNRPDLPATPPKTHHTARRNARPHRGARSLFQHRPAGPVRRRLLRAGSTVGHAGSHRRRPRLSRH